MPSEQHWETVFFTKTKATNSSKIPQYYVLFVLIKVCFATLGLLLTIKLCTDLVLSLQAIKKHLKAYLNPALGSTVPTDHLGHGHFLIALP